MAANTSPIFGLTPRIGIAALTTGVTTRANGAAVGTACLTAGTNGTKIEEITVKSETQPADSVVTIWIDNTTTAFIFDEFDIGAPAAGSTTVAAYRETRYYRNLVLPNGWILRATVTVTPTTGAVLVFALGSDF
jgi:hypothetical protein